MIRPEDNIQFVLEKIAKKEDKRTYPFSRAATSPLTWGAAGATAGAGSGALAREFMKKLTPAHLEEMGLQASKFKVPGKLKAMALPAALLGASGAGAAALQRSQYQRASIGRARKGAKGVGASDRAVMEALRARQAMSKKSSDSRSLHHPRQLTQNWKPGIRLDEKSKQEIARVKARRSQAPSEKTAANVHVAIEKLAAKKLRVGEIEDRLGFYLDDPQEQQVRDMLGAQVKKRFALRHPWLTGIPTLGIAPAVSAESAYSSVFRRLMRSQPDLRTRHKAWQVSERDRERQDYKDETKRLLATQQERAAAEHGRTVGALATAALAAQSAHNERDSV